MMLILLHNLVFGIFLSGGEVHEKPSLLSVNPGLIIWTIVVFVLFLFLLRKFAWGPLIKALNNREDTIKNALENAEKQNKETAELIEQNKKIIAEANMQASKILNDARELSSKIKDEIVSKAHEESNRNIQKAKEQIQSMKETAVEQMKGDITDIAFKAAEKILSKNLDKSKQMDIIDEFMNKIPKN
ncbi:MAG: F0F1 ATP synthase subunit B [Ignavibacteria bacterium]|nr:F0F1 ATP synthase subunit B [Ignavibacteria bacterium]